MTKPASGYGFPKCHDEIYEKVEKKKNPYPSMMFVMIKVSVVLVDGASQPSRARTRAIWRCGMIQLTWPVRLGHCSMKGKVHDAVSEIAAISETRRSRRRSVPGSVHVRWSILIVRPVVGLGTSRTPVRRKVTECQTRSKPHPSASTTVVVFVGVKLMRIVAASMRRMQRVLGPNLTWDVQVQVRLRRWRWCGLVKWWQMLMKMLHHKWLLLFCLRQMYLLLAFRNSVCCMICYSRSMKPHGLLMLWRTWQVRTTRSVPMAIRLLTIHSTGKRAHFCTAIWHWKFGRRPVQGKTCWLKCTLINDHVYKAVLTRTWCSCLWHILHMGF